VPGSEEIHEEEIRIVDGVPHRFVKITKRELTDKDCGELERSVREQVLGFEGLFDQMRSFFDEMRGKKKIR